MRLATTVALPSPSAGPVPAVLLRTPVRLRGAGDPSLHLARLLAEQGYAVAVQECRGRGFSEGDFTPFEPEGEDGCDAVAWVAKQPWCDGRIALLGFGYSGYAAWAALAHAAHPVEALVVAFAARDPYAWLYRGGAFAFPQALRLALRLGERTPVAERSLDLERALRFRPLRGADRVALRRSDAFRAWADHPRRDAFWERLAAAIPERPPPVLLVAGLHDSALAAQLDDYAALEAARGDGPPTELLLGPWGAEHARRTPRGAGLLGSSLRRIVAFLERTLGTGGASAPVRFFVTGADAWREGDRFPPREAAPRRLFLDGDGHARRADGNGRLGEDPPGAGPPERFSYDPREPAAAGSGLRFDGTPLPADVEIAGRPRVVLFAASSARDTDFAAALADVRPDGSSTHLCDGIARCRNRDGGGSGPTWLEPDLAVRLEIDLGGACHRFRAGHRIRLEISSASARFDRNPNTRVEPALATDESCTTAAQTVHHDPERPSQLLLPVTSG